MFGVGSNGRLTFVTEAFANELESDPETLTGTPLEAVVSIADGSDPRAVVEDLVAAAPGTSSRWDGFLHRSDGTVDATIELTTVDGDGVVGTVRTTDGTDERFRHLFEQSHRAIVSFEIVDIEPIVRTVNTAFVETFGYSEQTIVGESLNEYIVPEEREDEATSYDRRTASGETNYAVVTRETVDGRRDFVYRGLSYTSAEGRRYGFAIYTDVTGDRRRRRRLQVLHRVLRHNLRNDLSVVVGMADYIRAETEDAELGRVAGKILTAAERLTSVSEQARDVEVALEGATGRATDAANLARSVAREYSGVQVDTPEAATVAGGPALYDAIDNLVENAVSHTPDGAEVWVTVENVNDETFISVADDGPGIPDIERGAVFEDRDITTLNHGTGLGLWLARWVVEASGGELRYDRADGWTVVTLWLPSVDADIGEPCVLGPDVDSDPTATR